MWTKPTATDLRFGFEVTMYMLSNFNSRIKRNRPCGFFLSNFDAVYLKNFFCC